MTTETAAGTRDETPVFFDTVDHSIFGVVTQPTGDPLGTLLIVLSGGGIPLSAGRNRFSVRLCRGASELGFHALRFDYHGVGESEGAPSEFRVDQPFTADLMGAVEWARRAGIDRVVLVGSCFGARTALASTPLIHELDGLALISAPVLDMKMGERLSKMLATGISTKDFARRALRPKVVRGLFEPDVRRAYRRIASAKWRTIAARGGNGKGTEDVASQLFVDPMAELTARKVPTLVIYGSDEDLFRAFRRARTGRLGRVLEEGSETIELVTLPGVVHGFTSIAIQDQVFDSLTGWLGRLAADTRASATPTA